MTHLNLVCLADAEVQTLWTAVAALITAICAVIAAVLNVVAKWPSTPQDGQSPKKSWRALLPHVFYALSLICLVYYMHVQLSHVPKAGYATFNCDALGIGGGAEYKKTLTGFVETGSDAPAIIGLTNLPVRGTTVTILASYGATYKGRKGIKLRCHFSGDVDPTTPGSLVDFVIIQKNLTPNLLTNSFGIPSNEFTADQK